VLISDHPRLSYRNGWENEENLIFLSIVHNIPASSTVRDRQIRLPFPHTFAWASHWPFYCRSASNCTLDTALASIATLNPNTSHHSNNRVPVERLTSQQCLPSPPAYIPNPCILDQKRHQLTSLNTGSTSRSLPSDHPGQHMSQVVRCSILTASCTAESRIERTISSTQVRMKDPASKNRQFKDPAILRVAQLDYHP